MTGIAQVAFSDKANGSLIKRDGKVVGSSSSARSSRARATSTRARPRPRPTTPARTTFANLGPDQPRPREERQGRARRRSSSSSGPYNPGLTIGDIPVDAVTTSALGHRSRTSRRPTPRSSRAAIAAVRNLPLATRAAADRRQHRRPLARLLRRARRQRPRAQPRTRQGAAARNGTRSRPASSPASIVVAAIRDSFPKLDPRLQVRNPVMFIVELGSVITTVIFFLELARGHTASSGSSA